MIEMLEWKLCDEEMPPFRNVATEHVLILCEDYDGGLRVMHLPGANGLWWDTKGAVVPVNGNGTRPQYAHPFYAWARIARPMRVK